MTQNPLLRNKVIKTIVSRVHLIFHKTLGKRKLVNDRFNKSLSVFRKFKAAFLNKMLCLHFQSVRKLSVMKSIFNDITSKMVFFEISVCRCHS